MFRIVPPECSAIQRLPKASVQLHRAAQHDVDHGMKGVVRQAFSGANEVARRIVHQGLHRPEPLDRRRQQSFDLLRITHIAGRGQHLAAGFGL